MSSEVRIQWPPELEALRGRTVVDVETAAAVLDVGRTLAYSAAREEGRLCEGVRVLRVGRLLRVPVRDLLAVLGYSDLVQPATCRSGGE